VLQISETTVWLYGQGGRPVAARRQPHPGARRARAIPLRRGASGRFGPTGLGSPAAAFSDALRGGTAQALRARRGRLAQDAKAGRVRGPQAEAARDPAGSAVCLPGRTLGMPGATLVMIRRSAAGICP
jgi:hypothetical protein